MTCFSALPGLIRHDQFELLNSLLRGSHLESMALDFEKTRASDASFVQLRNRMEFAPKALRFEVLPGH